MQETAKKFLRESKPEALYQFFLEVRLFRPFASSISPACCDAAIALVGLILDLVVGADGDDILGDAIATDERRL